MPDLSNLLGALINASTPPASTSATANSSLVTLTLSKGVAQADLATLLATLQLNDVVPARVLPPRFGSDFIEIAGQALPAQLPPDVRPGETLMLQVTNVSGDQITVRNLGPIETNETPAPKTPAPSRNVINSNVMLTPRQTQVSNHDPATGNAMLRQAQHDNEAPAKVQPRAITPDKAAPFTAASIRASSSPGVTAVRAAVHNAAQQVSRTIGDLLKSVKFPDTPLTRTIAAVAPQAPARLPSVLARLEAALPKESDDPRIATLRTLLPFTARLALRNESTLAAQIEAYVSHVVEGAEPKLAQLLRALTQTTAELPIAEEREIPQSEPPQPASSPAPSPNTQHEPSQSTAPDSHVMLSPSKHDPPNNPTANTVAQGRALERTAAIDHDLKSVVLSLLRNPTADRSTTLMQALNETYVTLTAAQFNTLSGSAQNPGTVAFTLPAYFHEGGKPAQIRISRDAEGRGAKFDANTFHVAFVLDTANLGTVAIDLQSTGRSVKIDVKTERKTAATHFTETLHALRNRLEQLKYRIASAGASALERKAEPPKPTPPVSKAEEPGLDLRA